VFIALVIPNDGAQEHRLVLVLAHGDEFFFNNIGMQKQSNESNQLTLSTMEPPNTFR
jgi:hypothetical protein